MSDNPLPAGDSLKYECRVRSRQTPEDLESITISADDKELALAKIHRDGYLVVSIREIRDLSALKKNRNASPFLRSLNASFSRNSVTTRELIFFAVQLSTLLNY